MEHTDIATTRGKNKILLNGYLYVKQKDLANNLVSYECELRRGSGRGNSQCKAKVKLNADLTVVGYVNEHTHGPNEGRGEMLLVRERMKRRATDSEETPQQIIGEELQGLSQQAAVQMVP